MPSGHVRFLDGMSAIAADAPVEHESHGNPLAAFAFHFAAHAFGITFLAAHIDELHARTVAAQQGAFIAVAALFLGLWTVF